MQGDGILLYKRFVLLGCTCFSIAIALYFIQNGIQHQLGYREYSNSASAANPFGLYDDFESSTYKLKDGQTSPNAKWRDEYNGFGAAGVLTDGNDNSFFMYPKKSIVQSETHSNLVRTVKKYKNFDVSVDMATEKQLRQNNRPSPWEAAWILFRYADKFHHYYFVLKNNGYELGKVDNDRSINKQLFLVTEESNSTRLHIGIWQHLRINMNNNHIRVWMNGSKIIDFIDTNMTDALKKGYIGLYDEDALVKFDNIYIKSYR
jgi:hypothetical protein